MSGNKIKRLTDSLSLSFRGEHKRSLSSNQATETNSYRESQQAKRQYILFSNFSKQQQKELVKMNITARRPGWKQEYYRINNYFSNFPQEELQEFPHNNDKYNVQFLHRSLRGRSLRQPQKGLGYFENPHDNLLSEHFKPILRRKRAHNETYEIQTSMFGKTWVDTKRENIMDQYTLQANPFSTPASNALISTMRKQPARHKL